MGQGEREVIRMIAPLRSLKARAISPNLHRLAYVSGASALRARAQLGNRIIMFHGIDGQQYPVEVFEAQLRYLRRHFSVVPLETLVRGLERPDAQSSGQVALTFDDGFRSHYAIVHSLLRRLELPATFFVCPGLIERRQWLWSAEVSERVASMSLPQRQALVRTFPIAAATAEALKAWMKTLPTRTRLDVERTLRAMAPGFVPSEVQRTRLDTMTWGELASLDTSLITIGSHTVNHPMLTQLDVDDARMEIVESRRRLEEKLGRAVEFFCYPAGAYSDPVITCVRECYRAAVTTDPGFVRTGDDRHLLRRVPAIPELAFFAWLLHRPTA